MSIAQVSTETARHLALSGQRLSGHSDLAAGKEGAAQVVERLGYVQLDTIHVIKRAHHHTLWTRHPGYHPEMLHELLAIDRRVFEYWGHAASYLPMSDYRFFLPRMAAHRNPSSPWMQSQVDSCKDVIGPVLQRIRDEGPLRASDFKPPDGTRRGPWWDWKPAKMALEILFWRGELMISERRKFQRVYDLTERVLPADVDRRMPEPDEAGRFFVRRALEAHGVATLREIHRHMPAVGSESIAASLHEMVAGGEVVEVQVGGGKKPDYLLAATVEAGGPPQPETHHVVILSPFDNLVIERARTKRLFGFDYALECYVPAAKRKHGYFVLPILWRGALVGRLDPKADRKARSFLVRSLSFEADTELGDELLQALADGLAALARFNECDSVVFESVAPKRLARPLTKLTKAALAGS